MIDTDEINKYKEQGKRPKDYITEKDIKTESEKRKIYRLFKNNAQPIVNSNKPIENKPVSEPKEEAKTELKAETIEISKAEDKPETNELFEM